MKVQLQKHEDGRLMLVLPAEITSALNWGRGDTVEVEIEADALKIIRTETFHARAMKIARKAMEKYRTTFVQLAKN